MTVKPGSANYGKVIYSYSVGGQNEAHHGGFTDDRRQLWLCGLESSKIFIFDVHSNPAKPHLVKTIDNFEKVTGGAYDARVSYLGAPLLHTSGNLADVVHLPLPAGNFSLHKRFMVPAQAPSGRYTLHLTATNQHDRQLLCVNVPFRVR